MRPVQLLKEKPKEAPLYTLTHNGARYCLFSDRVEIENWNFDNFPKPVLMPKIVNVLKSTPMTNRVAVQKAVLWLDEAQKRNIEALVEGMRRLDDERRQAEEEVATRGKALSRISVYVDGKPSHFNHRDGTVGCPFCGGRILDRNTEPFMTLRKALENPTNLERGNFKEKCFCKGCHDDGIGGRMVEVVVR